MKHPLLDLLNTNHILKAFFMRTTKTGEIPRKQDIEMYVMLCDQ